MISFSQRDRGRGSTLLTALSLSKGRIAILLLALWLGASPLPAVTFTPIAHLSALGGQYFTGSTHSNGANIDSNFVPVIGINSKLYLIPIYIGSYHETQSVYNFLGQNTLVTKQLDQTGVLRAAWAMNANWRLKPRAGFTKEWIQQSTDENLWNGLFNYRRTFGGVSAERVLGNGSLEFGFEYGSVQYPNYQALIGDSRLTSTGINQNAGTNVLNFNTDETSINYQLAAADKRWNISANFTWMRENFVDQKIITTDTGGFEAFVDKQRTDDIFNLALGQGLRPNSRWAFNLGESIQYYTSNQNSFDSTQPPFGTPYTYRYYNFVDMQLNPAVTLYVDDARWDFTVAGTYGYRRYSHRRMQDGTGAYLDTLIYSMNRGVTITGRYAFGKDSSHKWLKGLYAVLTGNVLTYWSNTRFEANYPYNYTVYTYLGGLSWEY